VTTTAAPPSAFALALAQEIEQRVFFKFQTRFLVVWINGHFLIHAIPKGDVVDLPFGKVYNQDTAK
jgi:hypothetical protein